MPVAVALANSIVKYASSINVRPVHCVEAGDQLEPAVMTLTLQDANLQL